MCSKLSKPGYITRIKKTKTLREVDSALLEFGKISLVYLMFNKSAVIFVVTMTTTNTTTTAWEREKKMMEILIAKMEAPKFYALPLMNSN